MTATTELLRNSTGQGLVTAASAVALLVHKAVHVIIMLKISQGKFIPGDADKKFFNHRAYIKKRLCSVIVAALQPRQLLKHRGSAHRSEGADCKLPVNLCAEIKHHKGVSVLQRFSVVGGERQPW